MVHDLPGERHSGRRLRWRRPCGGAGRPRPPPGCGRSYRPSPRWGCLACSRRLRVSTRTPARGQLGLGQPRGTSSPDDLPGQPDAGGLDGRVVALGVRLRQGRFPRFPNQVAVIGFGKDDESLAAQRDGLDVRGHGSPLVELGAMPDLLDDNGLLFHAELQAVVVVRSRQWPARAPVRGFAPLTFGHPRSRSYSLTTRATISGGSRVSCFSALGVVATVAIAVLLLSKARCQVLTSWRSAFRQQGDPGAVAGYPGYMVRSADTRGDYGADCVVGWYWVLLFGWVATTSGPLVIAARPNRQPAAAFAR